MIDLKTARATGRPLLMPGAHDALSARMIEEAGFAAYGIGGAALAATQLGLPDVGLQSFGEYRDAVGRIMEGSNLPVMIDGENGFGDVKAITRTVRTFERLGGGGVAFEDIVLPPRMGRPPVICPLPEIAGKLEAALDARSNDEFMILGRTDAAYLANLDEALSRAKMYESVGVDGLVLPGLPDLDAYKRLRDAVAIPIIAIVAPGTPWFALSVEQMTAIGIEAALYPLMLLSRVAMAMQQGLDAFAATNGALPDGFDLGMLGRVLRADRWAAVDANFAS